MKPRKYEYNWLHILTGATGTSTTDDKLYESELLRRLNKWNSALPEVWKYWYVG